MNRRDFHRSVLAALGAGALPRPLWPAAGGAAAAGPPRVNGERLNAQLAALAEFGKNELGGVSRVAYTAADVQGRAYVMGLMRAAALDPGIDAAGNIIARRAGRDAGLAPLMIGSHIDSVPEGGKYDGTVGSLGAIEVARVLAESRIRLRHPLEVVVFQNEEHGSNGSRALSGEFGEADLAVVNASGRSRREGMAFIGGDPARLDSVRRKPGDVAAYLELHIEQGGLLEAEGVRIGVVEGIVGNQRWDVVVTGEANHGGTTPMDRRRDALLAAGHLIVAVNRIATSVPGRQVATVGKIEAFPGAPNVVPGRVTLTLEMRDLDRPKVQELFREIEEEARLRIGPATGTTFEFRQFHDKEPSVSDERIRRLIEGAAAELGLSARRMPSSAGHDSQNIARLGPMGMIFIPSVGGISHSAREFSRPEDITAGADVLLRTLLRMDAERWA